MSCIFGVESSCDECRMCSTGEKEEGRKIVDDRYLYRAKRTDNGGWVEGFYAMIGKKHVIISKESEGYYTESIEDRHGNEIVDIDKSTICQCTGLKDKNCNIVFENDIMSAHLDDRFPEDITYARVIWGDIGYCLIENGSIDIQPLEEIDMEYFAVCGNVFDNPELLEV